MNNVVNNVKLIDSEELLRLYPALAGRGKSKLYRLQWLVRSRKIPLIKIGRRVYFDPRDIDSWLESQKIPVQKGVSYED